MKLFFTIVCLLCIGFVQAQNNNKYLDVSVGLITNSEFISPLINNKDKIPYTFAIDYTWYSTRYINFMSGVSISQFAASHSWGVKTNQTEKNYYSFENSFITFNIQTGVKLIYPLFHIENKKKINIYTIPQFGIRPIAIDEIDYNVAYHVPINKSGAVGLEEKRVRTSSALHCFYNQEFGMSISKESYSISLGCFINTLDVFSELRKKSIDNYSLQNILPDRKLNWGIIIRIAGEL